MTGSQELLATVDESVPPMLVRSREDGRILRFFRAALIVGGAILVWIAIATTVLVVWTGVNVANDLPFGSDSDSFTDSNGSTCDETEVQAVPELLCPASLTP